ncbi:hypothetical protein NDU88_001436 [Pleurodeles waltl]|uniref:Uncharacterized protein n=1 Tax=Pleurodeles waltl TaxID=8319 RepID=A0AAV7MKX6_PLEWA|nr:hypothetical protein NDU88_001436 [Pleurodeles waltl]
MALQRRVPPARQARTIRQSDKPQLHNFTRSREKLGKKTLHLLQSGGATSSILLLQLTATRLGRSTHTTPASGWEKASTPFLIHGSMARFGRPSYQLRLSQVPGEPQATPGRRRQLWGDVVRWGPEDARGNGGGAGESPERCLLRQQWRRLATAL